MAYLIVINGLLVVLLLLLLAQPFMPETLVLETHFREGNGANGKLCVIYL